MAQDQEQIQIIELQDMQIIVHGLKMSGFSFIETDAIDGINERIRLLPSSEHLVSLYDDPREVKRVCAEVGRIMELIDYYGTRNEESKARYKAKTGLPPRYKNLEWSKGKEAKSKMKTVQAQGAPDASSSLEAVVQDTKNTKVDIGQVQQELQDFVNELNQQVPEIMRFLPPQYQGGLAQQQAIMNGAANNLYESAESLKQDASAVEQASLQAGEISQATRELAETQSSQVGNMGDFEEIAASKDYVKNIVKLSSNLEGNGILSEKLLTYAKNLRDSNPKAYYDLREVDILLKHANMNKEADVLVKTAGWFGKKDKQPQQDQQDQSKGTYGLIDPGDQKDEKFQVGDAEQQFKNDIGWLAESWKNLVDFFSRYVRDADILETEWSKIKDAPEKVAKINELKQQAKKLEAKVLEIQNSGNFDPAIKMMGDDLLGGDKPTPGEDGEDPNPTTPNPTTPNPTDGTGLPDDIRALLQKEDSELNASEIDSILTYLNELLRKATAQSTRRVIVAEGEIGSIIPQTKISLLEGKSLDPRLITILINHYTSLKESLPTDTLPEPGGDPEPVEEESDLAKQLLGENRDAIFSIVKDLVNFTTRGGQVPKGDLTTFNNFLTNLQSVINKRKEAFNLSRMRKDAAAGGATPNKVSAPITVIYNVLQEGGDLAKLLLLTPENFTELYKLIADVGKMQKGEAVTEDKDPTTVPTEDESSIPPITLPQALVTLKQSITTRGKGRGRVQGDSIDTIKQFLTNIFNASSKGSPEKEIPNIVKTQQDVDEFVQIISAYKSLQGVTIAFNLYRFRKQAQAFDQNAIAKGQAILKKFIDVLDSADADSFNANYKTITNEDYKFLLTDFANGLKSLIAPAPTAAPEAAPTAAPEAAPTAAPTDIPAEKPGNEMPPVPPYK